MLPFMAQGAVMSVEDGYVLARALAASIRHTGRAEPGLERYEQLRLERTARVQGLSRGNMQIFHNIDDMDRERLAGHRSAHEWLYGYTPDDLDYRF